MLFTLVCRVRCFFKIFYGRLFFCFVVSSHWESLVLGYVDLEIV